MKFIAVDPKTEPIYELPDVEAALQEAGFVKMGYHRISGDHGNPFHGEDGRWFAENAHKATPVFLREDAFSTTWADCAPCWSWTSIRLWTKVKDGGLVETKQRWERLPSFFFTKLSLGRVDTDLRMEHCATRDVTLVRGGVQDVLAAHERRVAGRGRFFGDSLADFLELQDALLQHSFSCVMRQTGAAVFPASAVLVALWSAGPLVLLASRRLGLTGSIGLFLASGALGVGAVLVFLPVLGLAKRIVQPFVNPRLEV